MEILGLFPIPVLKMSLNRKFTAEELNEVNILKQNSEKRETGSFRSINTSVLDRPALSNLKDSITEAFDIYINEVIKAEDKVTSRITTSWLNWQNGEQVTHVHKHPNSYLSAVLYIEAYEEDRINFLNKRYHQIQLTPKEYTPYNGDTWLVYVKSGDILIFPSNLSHGVDAREKDKGTRVSLAVNMFPTGKLGNKKDLTELII